MELVRIGSLTGAIGLRHLSLTPPLLKLLSNSHSAPTKLWMLLGLASAVVAGW